MWSCEEEAAANADDALDSRDTSRSRKLAFRLLACGIPTTLGLVLFLALLVAQERLVIDPETHWPKLQWPPTYLEEPGHEITGHRYLYDPVLGWRNIPNWKATSLGRPLTINSKGLRDGEHPYVAADGFSRILVLGDSYAWGYGVADDEIFTEVLESRLQFRTPKWDVVNTAVSGWGTDQAFLYLTQEGFKYSPSVVVLAFFLPNDPDNNVSSLQYGLNKPVFMNADLELENTPVPLPGKVKSERKSELNRIGLTLAILKEMAKQCSRRNCQFVIMKFGRFLNLDDPRLPSWEVRLESELESLHPLFYLDLDEKFLERKITRDQLVVGNDDGHWNAFGHQVTAEILREFLFENGLLNAKQ